MWQNILAVQIRAKETATLTENQVGHSLLFFFFLVMQGEVMYSVLKQTSASGEYIC